MITNKKNIPENPSNVMKGHKGPVYVVKYNKDGQYCMSGSQDRQVILWNPNRELPIKVYQGVHNYEILDLAITSDNERFASVGGDKAAYIWDVKTGQIIRKYEGHIARINSVAFNTDITIMITGSYDSTIRIWDLKSYSTQPIEILKQFKDSVSKIIMNGTEFLASSVDGYVRTYDIRMGEIINDNLGCGVLGFALSNDKKTYAASCLDNKIRLVDKNAGEILKEYSGHRSNQYTVGCQYTFDDAYILSGSEDSNIYVYDILKESYIKKLKNHCRNISYIDVSPEKTKFLSASFDNTITQWTCYK